MLKLRKTVFEKDEEFLNQIKMKINPTHWFPFVRLQNLNKVKDSRSSTTLLVKVTEFENEKNGSEITPITGSCTKGKGQLQPNKDTSPSKPYKCPLCQRDFISLHKLGFHTENKHQDVSNPYLCFNCPSSFKNLNDLNNHLITQHPADFKVQKRSSEKKRNRNTLFVTSISKHKCPHCPKTFSSPSSLKRHTKLHFIETNWTCKNCSSNFKSLRSLQSHQKTYGCQGSRRHYSIDKLEMDKPKASFSCTSCGKSMSTRRTLTLHTNFYCSGKISLPLKRSTKSELKILKCTHCTETFKKLYNKNQHEQTHGDKHLCPYCTTGFNSLVSLSRHKLVIHLKSNCSICSLDFDSPEDLKIHKDKVHILNGINTESSTEPNILPELTNLSVNSNNSVDIGPEPLQTTLSGRETSNDARIYRCDRCAATFKQDQHLRKHRLKNICEAILARFIECQKCGEFFGSKSSFKKHKRLVHPDEVMMMLMPKTVLPQHCDIKPDTDKDGISAYQTASSKSEEISNSLVKVEGAIILECPEIVPTEMFTNTYDPDSIKIDTNVSV